MSAIKLRNVTKLRVVFVSLFFLLHGCGEEKKVEQGHSGATIDVAKDVKKSPRDN